MDDLKVTNKVVIPAAELQWRFDTSGGPGGQHANKSSTRAELSFDVAGSPTLDSRTREKLSNALADELTDGVITVRSSESRSQWRNRQLARRKLADVLQKALRPPTPVRRPTRPTRASRERRLSDKRARSETKRLRQKPPDPD